MKKQIIFLLVLICLVLPTIVNAEVQSLPPQKQGSCVLLEQTCSNCTYVNIDAIKYPNSTSLYLDTAMDNEGYGYTYSFCGTDTLGSYIVRTCGDVDGIVTCINYDFEVTLDGYAYSSTRATFYIIFTILFFIIAGIVLFFGLRSSSMSVLVLSVLGTLTFIFFAFQMLIINPNVVSTNFYDLLIVWFDIYSKVYIFCLAVSPFFILYDLIMSKKRKKQDKMQNWGLIDHDE